MDKASTPEPPEPQTLTVWGLDPGHTTGFACIEIVKGKVVSAFTSSIAWESRMAMLHRLLVLHARPDGASALPAPEVLVIEDFRLYATHASAQVGSNFPSVNVIGATQALLWSRTLDLGRKPIKDVYQMASSIARIQLPLSVIEKTKTQHERDAISHILYYLINTHRPRFLRVREELEHYASGIPTAGGG